MNILVFSWRDLRHPLAGGAEQVMHEHMKGWIDAGNKVTLLSSKVKNFPNFEIIDGVKIVRSGYQYLGVQVNAFFYYLLHRKKFDIVVDQFHGIPFFTPLFVRKPKLAVLQEVAKEVWFKNPLSFPVNWIVGVLGYVFEPFIFIFYRNTKFMVGSNSAKRDLIKFGIKEENVTIVPHGALLPKKLPKHTLTKTRAITFLGALSSDKGIIDALKTFKILNALRNYKFWIIGRSENKISDEKLKIKAKEMNLKVKFWGRVGNKKKFELLSKSFVLINPSIREGWGLVNIEANAVNTPVIAYPSQGLIDSVKNGVSGILTKSSTPEALAVEVERLVNNKVMYDKLSNKAKEWASNFDWTKSKKESLKLLHNIISVTKKKGAISDNYSKFNPAILDPGGRKQIGKQIINVLNYIVKDNDVKRMKVLDIGCATGVITKLLADNFGQVYGIDVDKEALHVAIKNYSNKKNLIFNTMNAEKTKFPNNYFDIVVANQIYYCFDDPKIFFNEIYRVLKPGGICFLGARNKYTLWDAQYHLPLLAFMPSKLADFVVKLSGRSSTFNAQYRSYFELDRLLKKFNINKFTVKILKNPKKYEYSNLEKYSFLTKYIPIKLLEKSEPLLPNFIWILRKS